MPKTYSFLVKYSFLWRAAFNAWQVRQCCAGMAAAPGSQPCNTTQGLLAQLLLLLAAMPVKAI